MYSNSNGCGCNGFFGDDTMWGFLLIFFIFAFSGGGFGNFGGNQVTNTDLQNGFNFNTIDNELRQIGNGIAQSNYSTAQQLNRMQADQAQCCCNTQKEIIESRYDAEKNACNIINAVHSENEATRALFNATEVQRLRDKLEQTEREKLACQYQLSQNLQTANIVNQIKPCPVPAYITASPYTSNYCGCGCGYGCAG